MTKTIVVIGAGAAGLMAAIHAAGPERKVFLLERTADGGRKILISGGGRCNVLPSQLAEGCYITASSRPLMKKLLRSWPLAEQQRFFEEEAGLPLVLEPETGKLFPVINKARAVRDSLMALALRRGALWRPGSHVVDLVPLGDKWRVVLAQGEPILAEMVIIASGGLSVPMTGSDGFAFPVLERMGHTVHPLYPALTPLTVNPPIFEELAGVSLQATLRYSGPGEARQSSGGFLFTHRGYSGPAVLDISDVAVRSRLHEEARAELRVSWGTPGLEGWRALLSPSAATLSTTLRRELPARLVERLLGDLALDGGTRLSQLTRPDRLRLLGTLTSYLLPWTGDEGYKKAEVTGGGVALEEVNPRTMESRLAPGIFLAGELLDAFGPIGGYNFVWAWVTGRLAGRGVNQTQINSK